MAPNLTAVQNGHVPSLSGEPSLFSLKSGDLTVDGHPFLLSVPPNITTTAGCFLGFHADKPDSRHVVPIGRLNNTKFMSIFRFKVWWTTHWAGSDGRDVEHETQLLLLDRSATRPYVLLLPIIEGHFRASLQPDNPTSDFISLCVESGAPDVTDCTFNAVLYLHAGDDPYQLVKDAVSAVRRHMGTFKTMDEKSPPAIVDKFGWCTWDAFYLKVHPEDVLEGVKGLADGGCPPGFVLIDDGWQSISHDDDDEGEAMSRTAAGEQMPCRLVDLKENYKFRDYKSKSGRSGMGAFVSDLKGEFATVEQVYVWHALCGYWGGVRPGAAGLPPARVVLPRASPGVGTTMEDMAVDRMVSNGVGLVAPEMAGELYEGLHSHLEAVGIDGVKVDVIHILEMLSEDYGGRVELAKAYYKALTTSINKHLGGNGVIASMEHCNDFMLLGTESISLGRVGDDFWSTETASDPNGTYWLQGCHMVHCAYNSLWMGNFIHPDWDMFQSDHPCAAFHAASRAISGGPIYVSDCIGRHDFDLLRRLALPDGTILRCAHHALPTRDCLFEDPLQDGKTMLKIWNLNKFTGVLGAFNCQGGGWNREERKNMCAAKCSRPVTSIVGPANVEWQNGMSHIATDKTRLFAVYLYRAREMVLLKPEESIELTIEPFDYELLTLSPVVTTSSGLHFAPIGLVNMLNTGGAVQTLDYGGDGSVVEVRVKGAGEMKVYSSKMPVSCRVNGEQVEMLYKEGVVTVEVPWSGSSTKLCLVEYLY